MAYASAILIGVIGIATLTALTFRPTAQSRQIAVIIPPWSNDGLKPVAATGFAIVDTHWQRHVFIIDTQGDGAAIGQLRNQGFWLLDASGTTFCDEATTGITT